MLTHQWPVIISFLSIYEKIAGGWSSALHPAGLAHDAPPGLQVGPLTAPACGARTPRFAPLPLVPDCGALIMVTLVL